jgi:hypothetical protein
MILILRSIQAWTPEAGGQRYYFNLLRVCPSAGPTRSLWVEVSKSGKATQQVLFTLMKIEIIAVSSNK